MHHPTVPMTPMHNAIHSHYLATRRDYWIVWPGEVV
jgi:hypothetical protein